MLLVIYLGYDSDLEANTMDDSRSGTYFPLTIPSRAVITQDKSVTTVC